LLRNSPGSLEMIAKTKLSRNRISQNNLNKIRFSRFALEKH
jgi:hypothetical protein